MNRKHWLIVLVVLFVLAALGAILLRRSSAHPPLREASPSPTPSLSHTPILPLSPSPSPTTAMGDLPTITPPGPGEPTLPPEALAMRPAPTATPSPIPPPPTPTPTATQTPTPVPATGSDDVPMVEVPAGEFLMGLTIEEAWRLQREWSDQAMFSDYSATVEIPQLVVYLDTFSIDKFEVANGRYRRCVEANVCRPISSGRSDVPEPVFRTLTNDKSA